MWKSLETSRTLNVDPCFYFFKKKKNAANSWSPVSTGDMAHRDKLNP